MIFMISKYTMLLVSIDAQMYFFMSFNHEKTNNTSTQLPNNTKHKYELVLYNTTYTLRRSVLILINSL